MAKLSEDQIKWVLSIDAKGVNKEIAVVSSEINKLSHENKAMAADMKAAEKQIKQQERAMLQLAKAGKEDSQAYREAKATRDSARRDMDDYTRRINENNRSITENKQKINELQKSMQLNEMTMSQLKARASQLRKNLDATSASANPKEYKKLQQELAAVEGRMASVKDQGKNLIQKFSSMNNPVGTASRAVMGFGQALKTLIANPVGIVIMAIAGAFMALKTAIKSSEENMNKLQQLLGPLKVLFDALLLIIQKVAGAILDFSLKALDSITKLLEKLPFIGNKMKEINEKAREGIAIEKEKQALRVREREALIENAKREMEIAKLRNEAKQRDKYTNQEILDKLDRASQLEKEIAEEKIAQAKISLKILETEAARAENTEEVNRQIAEQTALISQLETDYYRKTMRIESERFTRIDELRREDAQRAKEYRDKKLADIEFSLNQEMKFLKEQLLSKKITQQEYEEKLNEKRMESLKQRLSIANLEKQKRLEIEQQILDLQLSISNESEKKRLEQIKKADQEVLKSIDNLSKSGAKAIEASEQTKSNILEESFISGIISQKKYDREKLSLDLATAQARLGLAKSLYSTLAKAEIHDANLKKEKLSELELEIKNAEQVIFNSEMTIKKFDKAQEDTRTNQEKIFDNYEIEAERMQEIFGNAFSEIGNVFIEFFALQDNLRQENLKSWEDWANAISGVIQSSLMAAQHASSQYFTYKKNALEADKAKELAAAGDNADQREKIERKYAEKALELKKKQANADAGIKIAQTISAGAMAVVQAFAQLGPIAGAIAASLIGATTAMNVASIIAQRNAIMSTTLEGGASSSSSTRRVLSGKETGGYFDVQREQDGKRYKAKFDPYKRGFINKPTVLVAEGEHGASEEWVASNAALKNPTIKPIIEIIDDAQKTGNVRTIDLNHLMRARMAGFSSGGFINRHETSSRASSTSQNIFSGIESPDSNLLFEIRDLLKHLKENDIRCSVNYHEFKDAEQKIEQIKQTAKL